MVQVGKGVGLDPGKLSLPHAGAKAQGGSGGVSGIEEPCDEGEEGADSHLYAFYTDVVDVPCLDAHVDDVRHDQRYGQLKACLSNDEQYAEDKFLLKWSKVCENAFQVLQDNPPFRVKFLFL